MVAQGCGQREEWTAKKQEGSSGGDGNCQYLDCGSFTGVSICQNSSNHTFKWVQCIICKLNFSEVVFVFASVFKGKRSTAQRKTKRLFFKKLSTTQRIKLRRTFFSP